MALDELKNCFADFSVETRIGVLGKEAFKGCRFLIFTGHNADGNLGCTPVIWAVEGDRRHWVATKAPFAALR